MQGFRPIFAEITDPRDSNAQHDLTEILFSMVAADLHETRMVLAQTRAPACGEVEGMLELLRLIALAGTTVTADALHCTRQMAAALRDRGADYVLTLKGNRSSLARDAAALFARVGDGAPFAEAGETGHGRREHRVAWVIPAIFRQDAPSRSRRLCRLLQRPPARAV